MEKNNRIDGLNKDKIDELLLEVNQSLAEKGEHGYILIAGGAVLAAVYGARESTKDIDALFKPSAEMREIIASIAKKHGLNDDWLNDGLKGFMTPMMQTETSRYMELSNLSVETLNAEPLLAMKLSSARTDSQDMKDSLVLMKALNIKSLEECYSLLEKYIPPKHLTPKASVFTEIAFEQHQKFANSKCQSKEESRGLEK